MTRPPRIFIGLAEVASVFGNLKAGFDACGIPSVFIDLSHHPFAYRVAAREHALVSLGRWSVTRVARARAAGQGRLSPWAILYVLVRCLLLLWALTCFRVFILGCGNTFFSRRDLWILALFRKRLVFVFLGSDSRPPFVDGATQHARPQPSPDECVRATAERKRMLQAIERHAFAVVCNPLSAHLHERPIINIERLGLPCPARAPRPMPRAPRRTVRVLHAPSSTEIKGTAQIRLGVAALVADGLPIEYVEIAGRPNREVLEELTRADIAVDQLYSDVPMAVFASEAASLGVPAVVCGYAGPHFSALFGPGGVPPTRYATPQEFPAVLRELVTDEAARRDLGRRAQEFVRREWNPEAVARRYLRVLHGDVPVEWMFAPAALRYLQGGGLPEERARGVVRALLQSGGPAALRLSDKAELERLYLSWASGIEAATPC